MRAFIAAGLLVVGCGARSEIATSGAASSSCSGTLTLGPSVTLEVMTANPSPAPPVAALIWTGTNLAFVAVE
jgi:hypothetical protein